ncbi:MAG: glycosyltransferase [Firmicutes bacterium HGW-Firmicutes-1]|jgi:undecaprenyl-phosphate 4-deoxy-4-formamido-L-arabinose transferase|nr:MAG: glycosyltransferase [Firmicutes bacterium HGW-Firmicutes-1]
MISIIVPVFNSEKSIVKLCHQITEIMINLQQAYEIILVDDGSQDCSYLWMKKLSCNHSNIISIQLARNYGQQNALLCGLRNSKGDYVVTIDDDLQYTPKDISKLFEKMNEGYDVVYGVPKEKVNSTLRNFGSNFKEVMFRCFLKKPKDITITSFRILRKSVVEKITLDKNSFVYLSAMTFRCTQNVANVSVKHKPRLHGKSNYSYFKLIHLMLYTIIYYSNCPLLKPLKKHKPQYIIKEIIK